MAGKMYTIRVFKTGKAEFGEYRDVEPEILDRLITEGKVTIYNGTHYFSS